MKRALVIAFLLSPAAAAAAAQSRSGDAARGVAPLVIGETFTIASESLRELRRVNVYVPPGYDESTAGRLPVLYMPDGGLAEDFLHVAGLIQVSVANGTMRPFLLVGIENTERRRSRSAAQPVDRIARRPIRA